MLIYVEMGNRKKARAVKAIGVLYLCSQPRRGARVALESTQSNLSLSERKYSRLPCPSTMSSDQIPKQRSNEQHSDNLILKLNPAAMDMSIPSTGAQRCLSS